MARDTKPPRSGTTIPLAPKTRELLESLKLADGEETWDHLLRRAADLLETEARQSRVQRRLT